MDYLNSISLTGWGILLKTFIPTWTAIFIADLLLYLLLPILMLMGLIKWSRENSAKGSLGAWRSCGKTWLRIGGCFLIFHIVLYFLVSEVLSVRLFDCRPFEYHYRVNVLGGRGENAAKDISSITGRKFKRRDTQLLNDSKKTGEGEGSLSSMVAQKIKTKEDVDRLENPQSSDLVVSKDSKEYKVVAFFYNNYRWLHHTVYAVAWLAFLIWFFLPGLTMQNQRTFIKH